jgi:hypothetical protein
LEPSVSNIQWLTTLHDHPPKVTTEDQWFDEQNPGEGTGAVVYIYIANQREKRIATGGPTSGLKFRPYQVDLICFLRSMVSKSEVAEADNDEFLDGLVAYIEADRTFDSDGVIFQAGEGDMNGAWDIGTEANFPKLVKMGMTQTFSVIHLTVCEIIQA